MSTRGGKKQSGNHIQYAKEENDWANYVDSSGRMHPDYVVGRGGNKYKPSGRVPNRNYVPFKTQHVPNQQQLDENKHVVSVNGTKIAPQLKAKMQKQQKQIHTEKVQEQKLGKEVTHLQKRENNGAPVATSPTTPKSFFTVRTPGKGRPPTGSQRRSAKRTGTNLADGRGCDVIAEDFLEILTTPAAMNVGDVLYSLNLAPGGMPNSRLQCYTILYDQYRLKFIEITFVTSCSTGTEGQMIGFFETDPDESVINDPLNVNKALSSNNAKEYAYWASKDGSPVSWKYHPPQVGRDAIRYVSGQGEARTISYGTFAIIAGTTGPLSKTVGTLRVKYHFQFLVPILENTPVGIYSAGVYTCMGTVDSTHVFGTLALSYPNTNNINLQWKSNNNIQIHNTGSYIIIIEITGTGLTAATFTSTSGAEVTLKESCITATFGIFIYSWKNPSDWKVQGTTFGMQSITTTTVTATKIRLYQTIDPITKEPPLEEKLRKLEELVRRIQDNTNNINEDFDPDFEFTPLEMPEIIPKPDPVIPLNELVQMHAQKQRFMAQKSLTLNSLKK